MTDIPGRAETEEVLFRIYNEFEKTHEAPDLPLLERIIRAIVNFFKSFGVLAWVLFSLGAGVVIAFIIFRVYKSVNRDKRGDREKYFDASEEIHLAIPASEYFEMSGDCAGKNDYSMAVVFLYRASISHMIESGHILMENSATNREILCKIRTEEKYSKCFRELASLSEHVLFNEETLGEKDYLEARESYRRGFM